ncbi:hypothetical protein AS888_21435 [Peribacillus simplex]|uniref:Uncharacterized protein n=1 Tax=Peribacillus simplex TaxID=1478 RepID=A0A109MX49_9BACI|nr:hypothetical protein AS888_21435 [Peribacillus simplex]
MSRKDKISQKKQKKFKNAFKSAFLILKKGRQKVEIGLIDALFSLNIFIFFQSLLLFTINDTKQNKAIKNRSAGKV